VDWNTSHSYPAHCTVCTALRAHVRAHVCGVQVCQRTCCQSLLHSKSVRSDGFFFTSSRLSVQDGHCSEAKASCYDQQVTVENKTSAQDAVHAQAYAKAQCPDPGASTSASASTGTGTNTRKGAARWKHMHKHKQPTRTHKHTHMHKRKYRHKRTQRHRWKHMHKHKQQTRAHCQTYAHA